MPKLVRKHSEWLLLALLLLFAFALRVWQSDKTPPGLHFDEAAYGLIADTIRKGNFGVFFSEFTGREPIYMYLVALSQLFFGSTVLGERLPAAFIGIGTIAAIFFAFRNIFADLSSENKEGKHISREARRIAWLAALAVAFSFWNLHLSREGYRANLVPLFEALSFGAAWRAYRLRTTSAVILAGVLCGLNFYTYLSARFMPFVFVAFGLYFLFFWWVFWRKKAGLPLNLALSKNRQLGGSLDTGAENLLGKRLSVIRLFFYWSGVTILVVAPLAIHFALHRGDFFQRSAQVNALSIGGLEKVWENTKVAVQMLTFKGTDDLKYNLPGRPIFDLIPGLFFYLGVAFSLWRSLKRPAYGFLLCWLVVLFLPSILSEDGNHPLRAYGILPAVMGLWAVGMNEVWNFLENRFKINGWRVGAVLATLVVTLAFYQSYTDYFDKWAKFPQLYEAFDGEYLNLANYLNSLPEDGTSRVVASELLDYPTTLYLSPKSINYHWLDPTQAVIIPAQLANGGGKLDYIVIDRVARLGLAPDWYKALEVTPKVEEIKTAEGRILGKNYSFQLKGGFTPEQLAIQKPACSDVNFNNDVKLLGWKINNQAKAGQSLSVTLYWQAQRASAEPWQIFVHLVDKPDAPSRLAQQDANGAFAQGWFPGDIIIGQYNLAINSTTPPGNYLLQVGMYNVNDPSYPRATIVGKCESLNSAHDSFIIRDIKIDSL
ncbi:hypothetical protein [Candidatus Chlorohelix sp.]|uniref:hypothetical protein n=1 Tax=Candidatus Chlorohelix sp. TaxID=3139201 RepID=UPI00302EFB01